MQDRIFQYCRSLGGNPVDIADWGIHLPERDLLFYKYSTIQEVFETMSMPEYMLRPTRRPPTVCFTDGSGTISEKPAGIGVVIYVAGYRPQYIAENIGNGTNNTAELRAVWRALQAFPDLGRKILIQSDSQYAIGSLTKPWNATANEPLIKAIRTDLELRRGNVTLQHVYGHAGIEGQEIADRLANIGRKLVTKVSL